MFRCCLFGILIVFCTAKGYTQACTNPGQVPGTEFPVCGSTIFSQTVVPDCSGSAIPTACTTVGITYKDKNPFWYKFTCFVSGTLGFVITPNVLTDDYDWQLFDITGHAPLDVYTDPTLFVSCNWSGDPGLTGASAAGTSSVNCAGYNIPTFNVMPLLTQGHNYLLMVSHFDDGTQTGYTLQFTGGSAGITDTTTSKISKAIASCNGSKISVKLNKKMKCSSLAANGSDFNLSATGIQITQATGINCSNGFDMDSIVLTLNNPLPAGTYTIASKVGTDGNTLLDNCSAQMMAGSTVTFTVAPALPALIDTIDKVNCRPDEITVKLSSPVLCTSVAADGSDFMITGPVSVSITAASVSCSGINTAVIKLTLSAPIKKGGIYQVAIRQGTDGNTLENACLVITPSGNSKSFIAADTLSALINYSLNRSCKADTVMFSGSGGSGVNNWLWTFDNTVTAVGQNTTQVFPVPGTHTIRLIITNGTCNDTAISSITINPLPAITDSVSKMNASCSKNDGSALVNVYGGSGSFTYLWTPGNFVTPSITGLAPGKYMVTITDSLGCVKKDSVMIGSFAGPAIIVINTTQVKCYGAANGSLSAVVTGGLLPYVYQWIKGTFTYSGNPLLSADTGIYYLTVTDARGCKASSNAVIAQPVAMSHTISLQAATCSNADGSAGISAMGGTPPYRYNWSPNSADTTASVTGLTSGVYIATVTDKNGCIDTAHITVGSNTSLSAFILNQANSCTTVNTGSATVSSNGSAPFTYTWLPAVSNGATAINLAAGNYVVAIKDSKGCLDTVEININNHMAVTATLTTTAISCHGLKDGSIVVTPGGAAPFTYSWQPAVSATDNAAMLPVGAYTVNITDGFGCNVSRTGTIIDPDPLQLNVLNYPTTCGMHNGSAQAIVQGGTQPYQYDWSLGMNVQTITNLAPGNLILTVTDARGCNLVEHAIHIGASQPLQVTLGDDINLCPGDNIVLQPGIYYSYKWQDGSTLPVYTVTHEGIYTVMVKDTAGCIANATLLVRPICNDLLFPDAFTPNSDGHNDGFGPLGTLWSVKDYTLNLFDRWGKVIFSAADPFMKWDGKINSNPAPPGTYIWIAKYAFNGKPGRIKKGTIILMK